MQVGPCADMKMFDTRWNGAHGIGRFAAELYARIPGFMPVALGGRPSSPIDPIKLSGYLWRTSPRLFFSPGYNVPVGAPCPFIFCIHDLAHLQFPEYATASRRTYYRLIVRPALSRAAAVLTVSEFSRAALCDWGSIDGARVINVGNGVSDVFSPDGPVFSSTRRRYFLSVVNHRPHKNFTRTLEAFAAARLAHDFDLLSTSKPTPRMLAAVDALNLTNEVKFLAGLSDTELAALYRGATGLVFPSLYEGFGLPIVEAMACGTPVLTSSVTAMPEIAGGAAILVDPTNVEAIADGLKRMASDEGLRRTLSARGLERAKAFSWQSTSERVRAALACAI